VWPAGTVVGGDPWNGRNQYPVPLGPSHGPRQQEASTLVHNLFALGESGADDDKNAAWFRQIQRQWSDKAMESILSLSETVDQLRNFPCLPLLSNPPDSSVFS
jgi:hypothetical protein